MLNKIKRPNREGFTIIEIMIVLAIAGLILLIVFLAVPALQRNARNTQRKDDMSKVLGAVSEYLSNNNGQLPTSSGAFNTIFSDSSVNFGYYTSANVTYNYASTAYGSAPAAPTSADNAVIYNYLTCSGNTASTANATQRSIIAYYAIEGSGGAVAQCVQS